MIYLRENTASQEVMLGPFVDDTDGKTAETALTIANTDIKLWKAGATSEVSKNSGGATHIASGRYYAVFDATDSNTRGSMRASVHVAGALPVWEDIAVLGANVYDSLFSDDVLDVSVVQWTGTNVPLPAVGGSPIVNGVRVSTAQGGSASSITLDASASTSNNLYKGMWIWITSGTGAGQVRLMTSYVGSTKVASVTPDWVEIPDNTSLFSIICSTGVDIGMWKAAIPNDLISGRVDASAQEVGDKTNYTAALTAAGLNAVLRTPLTEAYASPGAAPTIEQFFFMLHSALSEFAISSTTVTCKKLDGSTTAMTFTLDDASNPTSRTRAT